MPKRARKNQKRRKNVKKHVKLIKGLAAEDLIKNPALFHSPQFEQLPVDRKYQLIQQVKQYLALNRPSQPQGQIIGSSGGTNHDVFAQLMASQNALQKKENEVNQARAQAAANLEQAKRLDSVEKELARQKAQYEHTNAVESKIESLTTQLNNFNDLIRNQDIKNLQEQIKVAKDKVQYNNVQAKEKQIAELTSELKQFTTPTKQTPLIATPYPPELSEFNQRLNVENSINNNNNINNLQSDLAYQANAFETAGNINMATHLEDQIKKSPKMNTKP